MPRTKAEIGAPGLPLFSGRLALDTNIRLRWPRAGRIYRDMLDNEPAAGALRTAVMTLLRSDLQVTPGGSSRLDARIAGHIEHSLTTMRQPLGTALRQMASAYFYGFSVAEIVYRRNPDGTVGWADFAPRRQETLERWDTDARGRLTGFVQRPAPDYVLRTIPLTKAVHVLADDMDASPEGRGALRPMYRYWYMVTQFELLFGIALERFGTGIPVFQRVDNTVVLTEAQEDALADQAAALRQNEEAFVLLPPGLTFQFAQSPGLNAATYLDAIQAYRVWMLATGLAEFIALGTGETGSFALGKSKIDLFLKALTGLQDKLCEAINRQAIPRLLRANGWRVSEPPTVSLPAVREYDLEKLGAFAKLLSEIGAFHATPEDEAWFRGISDLYDVAIEDLEALHEPGDEADDETDAAPTDEPGADDMPDEEMPAMDDMAAEGAADHA